LDVKSTHWPEQKVGRPSVQLHAPDAHCVPTGQMFPQVPQLFASKLMFAQAPLQLDSPAGQLGAHAPAEHINPGGHAWPQNPQFATFEDKSTHSPSHKAGVCPTAH
jgi:hypothetical protein